MKKVNLLFLSITFGLVLTACPNNGDDTKKGDGKVHVAMDAELNEKLLQRRCGPFEKNSSDCLVVFHSFLQCRGSV